MPKLKKLLVKIFDRYESSDSTSNMSCPSAEEKCRQEEQDDFEERQRQHFIVGAEAVSHENEERMKRNAEILESLLSKERKVIARKHP